MATTISFQPSTISAGDLIDEVYANGPNGANATQFSQFLADHNLPNTAFGKLSDTQTGFVTGNSIAKFFADTDKDRNNQLSPAEFTQALGGSTSGIGNNGGLTISLDQGNGSIGHWGQRSGNANTSPTISFDNHGGVTINNGAPANGSSKSGLTIGTDGHGGYMIGSNGIGSFGNSRFGNQSNITIGQNSNGRYTVDLGNGAGSNGFGGNGFSISPTANGYSIGFGNSSPFGAGGYGTSKPSFTIGQSPNGLTLGFGGANSFGNNGFGTGNISIGQSPNGYTIGLGNNDAGFGRNGSNNSSFTIGQSPNGLTLGFGGANSFGNNGFGTGNISIGQSPNGYTIGLGNNDAGFGRNGSNNSSFTIGQSPNGLTLGFGGANSFGNNGFGTGNISIGQSPNGYTIGLGNNDAGFGRNGSNNSSLTIGQGPNGYTIGLNNSGNGASSGTPSIQINGNGSIQIGSGYGQGLPFGGLQNRLTPGEMVDRLLAAQPTGTTNGNALTTGFSAQDFNRAFNPRVSDAAGRFDADGNGRLSVNEILSWYGQFDRNGDGLDRREARQAFA